MPPKKKSADPRHVDWHDPKFNQKQTEERWDRLSKQMFMQEQTPAEVRRSLSSMSPFSLGCLLLWERENTSAHLEAEVVELLHQMKVVRLRQATNQVLRVLIGDELRKREGG